MLCVSTTESLKAVRPWGFCLFNRHLRISGFYLHSALISNCRCATPTKVILVKVTIPSEMESFSVLQLAERAFKTVAEIMSDVAFEKRNLALCIPAASLLSFSQELASLTVDHKNCNRRRWDHLQSSTTGGEDHICELTENRRKHLHSYSL